MEFAHPAIVVVTYNRPESFSRLLLSLKVAKYDNFGDIKLIISIDGGGEFNKKVQEIATEFSWIHGEKIVLVHNNKLGLKKHIIFCGDLTEKYGDIIILEDDLFVSINFYNFAVQAINKYCLSERIGGISLYAYALYESFNIPFIPIKDGFDSYFMQVPSSWGQIFTEKQWRDFKSFYNTNPIIDNSDLFPENAKNWGNHSWKKYFYKYLVQYNLFIVYPAVSCITNFGEKGTNINTHSKCFQVELENYQAGKMLNLPDFEDSNNKFDSYFELLPECIINLGAYFDVDTCIDIMGSKPLESYGNKYALSSKQCINSLISYDNTLIPWVLNILYKNNGNAIHYSLLENFNQLKDRSKTDIIANLQPIGYQSGRDNTVTSRYYKIGYYLLNPIKITGLLTRKINRFLNIDF